MNKLFIIGLIVSILLSLVPLLIQYSEGGWFEKKGEPTNDVWQESCNPIQLLRDGGTCQQFNYIIKQNAEMLRLQNHVNCGADKCK